MEKKELIKILSEKLQVKKLPDDKILQIKNLGAFWPHLYLAKIKCGYSGQDIISVYDQDCPYPVWHREEWLKHANPPGVIPDLTKSIFPQLFELFKKSPIPHKIGYGNENCEYTDDWFFSKDCFQCHSGMECQDVYYSYTISKSIDCISCVMSRDLTLCFDVINSNHCYESFYCINSNELTNCGFCFDCNNCRNCLFSCNLRNKDYYIFNQQVTEAEYNNFRQKLNLKDPNEYLKYIEKFKVFVKKEAYFRDVFVFNSENSTGNYLYETNNCFDGFFLKGNQDCYFCVRSFDGKDVDCMFCVGNVFTELAYMSSLIQINCYNIKYSSNLIKCNNCEYCFNCERCDDCFGCSGLVGKKYHIFNKEYSPEEYTEFRSKLVSAMETQGEYELYFPDYFAPVKFENSWSSLYFDLKESTSKITVPSNLKVGETYKDSITNFNYRITNVDQKICDKLSAPLPFCHYVTRIREHMKWIPYDGKLRESKCSVSGQKTATCWGELYDSKLLSSQKYQEMFLK